MLPRDRGPFVIAAALIRRLAPLVPSDRRAEWVDEWLGEIGYWQRHRRPASRRTTLALLGRCLGALSDALWLRRRYGGYHMFGHDLRHALRGVARQRAFSAV